MSLFRGCPGAKDLREVVPEDMECAHCGAEVEIWSDELSIKCPHCGEPVNRERTPSCIDWCSFAEQCLATDTYRRLSSKKEAGADEP